MVKYNHKFNIIYFIIFLLIYLTKVKFKSLKVKKSTIENFAIQNTPFLKFETF